MVRLMHLFKHTAIYGLATVLPRLLGLVLTPLHIKNLHESEYGIYQGIFAYMILGNVLLTYGMETAFFRFVNKESDKDKIQSTAITSLFFSTLSFFIVAWSLQDYIADWTNYSRVFVKYAIVILVLDTWAVIPFAWFRNNGKSINYTLIKIGNVCINLGLNLFFFLILPQWIPHSSLWKWLDFEEKIHYVFIANLTASLLTFLLLLGVYRKIKFGFSFVFWKKMLRYSLPVLVAGIAFSINEGFDRIFIRMLYPDNIADAIVGIYAACYKMGVFMTLFITAYKLGVEPFFFSMASDKKAPSTYASVTQYFIAFCSFIVLVVSTYTDIFKQILIPNVAYWEALWIVPLILIANMFLGIYHSLSVWYKVTDRTHYGAYISLIGGVITIVGNWMLIPIIGYRGSAITTLLAYGGMMLISYLIGQRKYPIPYRLFPIGIYLSLSIITSVLNFYFLNRNIWSGSFFILLYVIVVIYFERKVIRNFFKNKSY